VHISIHRLIIALAGSVLAGGCAHNNLLYNESRDKQAQQVVQAVGAAQLTGVVDSLSKTFTEVASQEETAAGHRAAAQFDWEVVRVSRAPSLGSIPRTDNHILGGLMPTVEKRLGDLGLQEPLDGSVESLLTSGAALQADNEAFSAAAAGFLGVTRHEFSSCSDVYAVSIDPQHKSEKLAPAFLAGLPRPSRGAAPGQFAELIRKCALIDQDNQAIDKLFNGKLNTAAHQLEQRVAGFEKDRIAAKQRLDDAVAGKAAAGAALAPAGSQLDKLADRARTVLTVVEAIDKANSLGAAHAVASGRLEHLEAIIGAIAGQTPDSSVSLSRDELVSVAIIRDIPSLADEADKALKEAKAPRLVPLVAAADYQRLVLQEIEAVQGAYEEQAAAARSCANSQLAETIALANVLRPLRKHKEWAAISVANLDGRLRPDEKRVLYGALATYGDEVKLRRVESAVCVVQKINAGYRLDLIRSRFAAAKWDNLMSTLAKVSADYHAAGIKTSDVTEFFKALGLAGIAIGVAL